jgi:hypothetical protein
MKKLFIDLEETIINDIDAAIPLWANITKIKKFIEVESPDFVGTFSFALLGPQEKANWRAVKEEIGFTIDTQAWEVDDLKLAFLRAMIGKVDKSEITDFLKLMSKDRVFEWMTQKDNSKGEFILIDDRAESHVLITKNAEMTIRVINISEV